ncbi:hypothetical protein FOA52_013972 [Chlamydomonas sp. UWO 241]|nr:hypothetical protein FOA52_013972 [Chlamydomonas sp. UWO 241]
MGALGELLGSWAPAPAATAEPAELGWAPLAVAGCVAVVCGAAAVWALRSPNSKARAKGRDAKHVNYIFCFNTGRSGSEYLYKVFAAVPDVVARHEAFPIMCGEMMHQFNEGNKGPMREAMPAKLEQIKRTGRGKVYVETNHTFGKGFGLLLPEHIPQEQIGVVILNRGAAATAASLLRCGDVPGRNWLSRAFYLRPGQARNMTQPPKGASPLQLCRWYVDEMMVHRLADFQQRFPRITYVTASLDQLNDVDFVQGMLSAFGLEATPVQLSGVVGVHANTRPGIPRVPTEVLDAPQKYRDADSLPLGELKSMLARMADDVAARHSASRTKWWLQKGQCYFPGSVSEVTMAHVCGMREELEDEYQVSLLHSSALLNLQSLYTASWAPDDVLLLLMNPPLRRCGLTQQQVLDALYGPSNPKTDPGIIQPGSKDMLQVMWVMGALGVVRWLWLLTFTGKPALAGF